jgi:PKD repeat protein
MGSSGADVTRLQQFLAADPAVYPEGTISGYYGALTEAAVKRFQCKNKIVCDGTPDSTGYGVTGPRTAAILSLQCPDGGGSGPASGFIKVTPTTGAPPLTVTAQATVNTARSCSAATYTVDFGDGSPQGVVNVPANGCAEMQQLFSHTYTRQGTYQVILRSGVHQVSATVTVSGVSIPSADDSIKASPLSGAVPLTVSFSGVVNASSACNAGPYSINFGDNQAVNISVAGCNSTNYSLQHTYTSGGTYTARLYRGNPAVNVTSVSINAGDSASTGGRFSVTPITGSTAQVRASFDLSSSCARYDLDWGDGSAHASQSEGSCAAGTTGKELTHTYDKAGSYTIKLKRGSSLNYTDTVGLSVTF